MNISWLVTGALSSASIPGIIYQLKELNNDLDISPYISSSAEKIVSLTLMNALSGKKSHVDKWPLEPEVKPLHVAIENSSDIFIIAPASLAFLTRFTSFDCSTPFTLALQCTKKPILIAPCIPPGAIDSPAYINVMKKLSLWRNLELLDPVATLSVGSKGEESFGFGTATRLISFVIDNTSEMKNDSSF